ncbi:MAG: serine acetyltransferase [Mucilaginibacter sp.]|uniref:serine acetyltransferase n=1 Tax=Mucilaginibacter sp. TaxID=1882438 RepID=UPI00326708C7
MGLFAYLFQDRKANSGNIKGQLILFCFRLVQVINRHTLLKIIFFLYLIWYRVNIEWILGVELPRKLTAGKGLIIYHGQALVVNQGVVLGENCVLRNSVTIGHKKLADGSFSGCPRIGNNVDIGANVCIIGDVVIGNNVIIGAGSVVTKSFPDNCVVVGNPARILDKSGDASPSV